MAEYTVIPKKAYVYERPNSSNFYMRYKLADGEWDRISAKTSDLDEAKNKGRQAYEWEENRKVEGIPSSKKNLTYFADLYVANLQKSVDAGKQVGTFTGYIMVVEKYVKPIIGNVKISSVSAATINHYENQRDGMWKGPISKSTINTHNVVLRGILREAVERRFIKTSDIPLLTVKGKGEANESRPPFIDQDMGTMKKRFPDWIDQVDDTAKCNRILLQHYVSFLAATGIRPGQEALGIQWKHVSTGRIKELLLAKPIEDQARIANAYYDEKLGIEYEPSGKFVEFVRIIVTQGKIHNRSDAPKQRPVIARDEIHYALEGLKRHTRRIELEDYLFPSVMGGLCAAVTN